MVIARRAALAAVLLIGIFGISSRLLADCTPSISYDNGLLDFGIAPENGSVRPDETVTFTNVSDPPCDVPISSEFFADSEFSVVRNDCEPTLTASTSCSYTMEFAADAQGVFGGDLLITTTEGDPNSPYDISLYASGALPASPTPTTSVSFTKFGSSDTSCDAGMVVVGETSTVCTFTIANTWGPNPLAIQPVTNANLSDSIDFSVAGTNCPTPPEAVGQFSSCEVTVVFTPQSAGSLSATLSITDNASPASQSVTVTGDG